MLVSSFSGLSYFTLDRHHVVLVQYCFFLRAETFFGRKGYGAAALWQYIHEEHIFRSIVKRSIAAKEITKEITRILCSL